MTLSLKPENRPALAVELRKYPYEVEVLRGDYYTGSIVNGVLAENGGPLQVPARYLSCSFGAPTAAPPTSRVSLGVHLAVHIEGRRYQSWRGRYQADPQPGVWHDTRR
jgi:hypothetical protein